MDEHKTTKQLLDEVAEADQKVTIGGIYVHYKGSDKLYKVLHFATLEATNELCVVYQPLYIEEILLFVRPVSVWLEMVEWEGKTVQRFTPVAPGL
jgi:hypothetical protein